MPQVNLSRNAENLIGWRLDTKADMDFVLEWLSGNGYPNGAVRYHTDDGAVHWRLEYSDQQGQPQLGYIGWIVALQNGVRATLYDPSMAVGIFTITNPA